VDKGHRQRRIERMARVTIVQLKNRVFSLVVAIAAAALIASGCGGDDDKKPAQPQRISVGVTERGKDRAARLSVPASVRAGVVTVQLRNTGKLPHSAGLIRLDGDHTPEEVLKIVNREGAPIPAWIHGAGGVAEVRPGATGTATQRLIAGNYFVLDDAEGVKQAFARFKVTDGEAGGELPEAPAKIEARDYSFTASGLKPGKNTIEFANVGRELHHVIAARIRPGATIAEVRESFQQEQGEPPLDFESAGSTQVLDGGVSQVTELNLPKPGKYALLCFIQDRKGGAPHVAKGMVTETTVR
jgi:plastocyanin